MEKNGNPLHGKGGNQYLSALETLGAGGAGTWPSPVLPGASLARGQRLQQRA